METWRFGQNLEWEIITINSPVIFEAVDFSAVITLIILHQNISAYIILHVASLLVGLTAQCHTTACKLQSYITL